MNLSLDDLSGIAIPSGFARNFLEEELYGWQEEALDSLMEDGNKVAMKTCNESGKTSKIVTCAIIWHMQLFPNSLTISTAGVSRQVFDQLIPNLRLKLSKYPTWRVTRNTVEAPNGSRYLGFSTNDAGKFEGWHTPDAKMGVSNWDFPKDWVLPKNWNFTDKSSLFIVVDEAKSVTQGIFDAIERCRPNRILVASSTGEPSGPFYNCFHSQKKRYKLFTIPYTMCDHLTNEPKIHEIEEQIRTLAPPLVQSMIYAEFPEQSENMVFDMGAVDRSMSGLIPFWGSARRASIDVSGGGDEQPLYIREGNKVVFSSFMREKDATVLVDKCIQIFRKWELKPEDVISDDSGLGEPVNDIFYRRGWNIRRLQFQARPMKQNYYMNRRTEIIFNLAQKISNSEIILPRDDVLREEASWHKYKLNDEQKLQLIAKNTMPRSPNRVDSLSMLFSDLPDKTQYFLNMTRENKKKFEMNLDFEEETEYDYIEQMNLFK